MHNSPVPGNTRICRKWRCPALLSSAVPADPNAAWFAALSGTRISDPPIEPTSRPPAATAR
jgi:hypothetical protein